MSADEFAVIQWNTQKETLFASLADLRNSQIYTDVLVSCEGSFYPAHRLILTLSSQYFSRVFQVLPKNGYPVFILCEIPKRIFEAILSYIYEGKVTIVCEDMASFMKAGIFLEVAGLKNITGWNGDVDDVNSSAHRSVNFITRVKQEAEGGNDSVDVVNFNSNSEKKSENINIGNIFNPSADSPLMNTCGQEENQGYGMPNITINTSIHETTTNRHITQAFDHPIMSPFINVPPVVKNTEQCNENNLVLTEFENPSDDNSSTPVPHHSTYSHKNNLEETDLTLGNSVSENSNEVERESSIASNIDYNVTGIGNDEENNNEHLASSNVAEYMSGFVSGDENEMDNLTTDKIEENVDLDEAASSSTSNFVESTTASNNFAKKHTRCCCRCKCCNKIFSSKRALDKHYIRMESFRHNKRSLRSSNEQSEFKDRSSQTAGKKSSKYNCSKSSDKQCNASKRGKTGNGSCTKITSFKNKGKSAAVLALEYCSAEKKSVAIGLSPTTLLQRNNSLQSYRPNKRSRANSDSDDVSESCSTNSSVSSTLRSKMRDVDTIYIKEADPLDSESSLHTDKEASSFCITDVVSLKESCATASVQNDPISIKDLQVLDTCITDIPRSDNSLDEVCDSNLKQTISKEMEATIDPGRPIKNENVSAPNTTEVGKPIISCDICSSEYPTLVSFRNHKQNDCKILECPYCFHTYLPSEKEILDVHLSFHAKQVRPFTCPECPYRARKSRIMDDHIANHKEIFKFLCPLCNFKGKSVKELQLHNRCNHPSMKIFD